MFGMKFMAKAVELCFTVVLIAGAALAQGPARGRIEPARDEAMELKAKHDLSVARWYLEKRKAYEGARDRLQEIMDSYAEFSRMDEVLFLLGEVNYKTNKPAKAGEFYSKMLKDFPSSEFAKKARERLVELKISPEATDDKKQATEKKSS